MKYLIPVIIVLSFMSCASPAVKETGGEGGNGKDTPGTSIVVLTEAQLKNAGIVMGSTERKDIAAVMKVNGKIDVPPQNIVSISFPLGGYLTSTKLLPGMPVKKGEVLGVLEDAQYIQLQQDYLTGVIKMRLLEKDYNRQKELNASQASSDKVFQQTQGDYESQKVIVQALAEKLRLIGINPASISEANISRHVNVYSPINGFVSKVDVNIGKYVSPTEVLFELVNPSDIHLALSIFQKDMPSLSIGQRVIAYSVNNPGTKYRAQIILFSRDIAADGSVEAHCHFDKYDKSLVPGLFMNAEIEVQNRNVYVLPSDAMVGYENKQYVFTEKGKNQFEMTEVVTGVSENGFTEIDGAYAQKLVSQHIVVKGAYSLLMKMKNTNEDE